MNTQTHTNAETVRRQVQSRFNPIRNLTPAQLSQRLDSFKAGYLREAAQTFQAIEERDDTLASVIPKRKKAAARHGFEVLTLPNLSEGQEAEAERHKAALEFFYTHLSVTHAEDTNERGSFRLLVRQMADAIGKRYACHEVIWQPRPDGLTAELRFVPLWWFENRVGQLRFLRDTSMTEGEALAPGEWLVTVGDGLMFASSVNYMFKRMSLQDWLVYTQDFGRPGLQGITDAAKDSPEWEELVTALENFSSDLRMVTSRGAEIRPIEIGATGQLPFEPLIDRMDRGLARIWMGGDLSTISKGEGLGASLQGNSQDTLEADDTEWLSETLNLGLDPWVIRYVFGEGVTPLAYVRIRRTPRKDIPTDIQVDTFLRDSGAPLGIKATLERYGRELPDGDEELLRKPAGPAPMVAPGSPAGAQIGNEVMAGAATLTDNAAPLLARAVDADLQPLRDRLARILQITDPEIFAARLRSFQAELPGLIQDINADPESARILEQTMAAALLNGMERGAKDRKGRS